MQLSTMRKTEFKNNAVRLYIERPNELALSLSLNVEIFSNSFVLFGNRLLGHFGIHKTVGRKKRKRTKRVMQLSTMRKTEFKNNAVRLYIERPNELALSLSLNVEIFSNSFVLFGNRLLGHFDIHKHLAERNEKGRKESWNVGLLSLHRSFRFSMRKQSAVNSAA